MSLLFLKLISDNAGKKIKKERKAWGMSRRRLAKLTYTDHETIESIENGYVCMLDFKLLRNICKILQISIFDFFIRPVSEEDILAMV